MFHGGMHYHFHGAPGRHDDEFDKEEILGKVYDNRVVGRLPKYLAQVKKWLALGTFGMVLRTLATLAMPALVTIATDDFILSGELSGLTWVALGYVGMALVLWAGQYLEQLYLSYAGQSVIFRLRTEMFDHLQQLSMKFFDRNKVGKLMSRVQNDVEQVQQVLTNGIVNILASILTLVGIIVIMMTMNARLALLTFAILPVMVIMVVVWQKFARRAFIKVRTAIAVVNDQLQEGISGVRVTQSLSREEETYRQFDTVNRDHLDANVQAVRLQALMMPATEIMTAIAYSVVIIFGGYQVIAGQTTAGVILGFLLYVQRFFEPVMELTMLYSELQRAMASGVRIFDLIDVEPEIVDSPDAIEMPPITGEVRFNHVSFSYEPGVEVLHDIDLTVRPGETLAIVGRTGAGKSSLMNLITRFYEIEEGEITIDGYNVNSVTQNSLRRQIGIVPQEPFLFSGSIEDNIRYGRIDASHEEVVEAAKAVGAHDFISRLEKGYDTPVGERGHSLSAGQRQFICLARAILANPPIMVLDEATSNVDTNSERLMQQSLRSVMTGRTSFVIAHRLSTVTNADRIVALEQGRIVEMGSHRELLEKKGLYYDMYGALSAQGLDQPGI